MDNMMCAPVVNAADMRCVRNIAQKNGELAREICGKVCELVRFVTANEGEIGQEPDIKCLLDELEVQNATMCHTIERLDFLMDMVGVRL